MPSTSIACGTLLVLIGILGYVNGVMTNHASPTALIPAAFGILLIILGVIARMKESLRKHLMHLAVIIALLGFVLTAGRLISKMSELTYSAAVVSQVSMALVCLLFVVLAVKSFTDARRRSEPAWSHCQINNYIRENLSCPSCPRQIVQQDIALAENELPRRFSTGKGIGIEQFLAKAENSLRARPRAKAPGQLMFG
jgi:hypothetical protein